MLYGFRITGRERMKYEETTVELAIELLIEVWHQFAVEARDGKLWAGGLPTLEEVEKFLTRLGKL